MVLFVADYYSFVDEDEEREREDRQDERLECRQINYLGQVSVEEFAPSQILFVHFGDEFNPAEFFAERFVRSFGEQLNQIRVSLRTALSDQAQGVGVHIDLPFFGINGWCACIHICNVLEWPNTGIFGSRDLSGDELFQIGDEQKSEDKNKPHDIRLPIENRKSSHIGRRLVELGEHEIVGD